MVVNVKYGYTTKNKYLTTCNQRTHQSLHGSQLITNIFFK